MSCSDGGGPAAGRSNGVFDFFQHRSLSLDGKAFPEPIDCKHCWAMPTNRHRSRARPNRRQPADECDLPRQIASRAGPVRNSAALSRFDLGNCCGADLGETPAARSGLGRFVAYSERGIGERIKAVSGSPAYGAIAWTTFAGLTLFGWIIFRCSQSTQQLKSVLNALRHSSFAHEVPVGDAVWVLSAFLIVCILQLWQKKYGPEPWQSWGISLRTVAYASSFIGLAWLTKSETNPFIYFQF
jgi:hypothetical protein